MNGGRKVLIYRVMFSQQLLNKSLTKREINERGSPVSQRPFWLVEILLRVYVVYFQCIYTHIQQFNKNKGVITGIRLRLSLGHNKRLADDKRLYPFLFSPASHLQGITP